MNKKVLFYALAINIISSFLGALVYKYFCETNQLFCGDTNQNPLAIYIPLVISDTIFIAIAFFLSNWVKRLVKPPILFFIIPVILAAMFNSEGGGFNINIWLLIVGIPPVLIATTGAWFVNRRLNNQANQ
ncbi:MAG: hypothetical protein A2Z11_04870 [Candidatus Woykebacteria bacterium RBG_16_43_9]|uniref:Uncharacterized protein n=1 Tax=Candidatus Woykebacteria bacterium RBG_16_43_9 TaxID=1802596 RepID=A0A1G1WBA9_9BACT|nr:MAG: hypothetical protein A2Z11_04870 [Candidatus Woykebacteria bacterium RBG_16_43_9]